MDKPFAPSCERNQGVILDVLKSTIKPTDKLLLEIGSGTGQHAVFMAPSFPNLQWQTSELSENHQGICQWIDASSVQNILPPVIFESGKSNFPKVDFDIVFTANTLHIMSWENVKALINQLGVHLKTDAQFIAYGPFNYNNKFTSQSNADFDDWLKQQEPHRGIRGFENIVELMSKQDIKLIEDCKMPSNNRILHFKKHDFNGV